MSKLLIIDDDELNGKLLQTRLGKKGFDCDYINNGAEGLLAIKEQNYDLVLLDIVMPELSGQEVLVRIREKFNNFQLPVIMVTAKDEASDVVDALKMGANDYLTKPVNMEIAVARISTQIKVKELIEKSLKSEKAQAITTMVTTLNHEINNPLAIAIGNITIMKTKTQDDRLEKTMNALNRITEIVRKIEDITSSEEDMKQVHYSDSIYMYSLEQKKKTQNS